MSVGKVTIAEIKNGDMTGVAIALRNIAEATVRSSQNWDNFQAICLQICNQAYEAGKSSK